MGISDFLFFCGHHAVVRISCLYYVKKHVRIITVLVSWACPAVRIEKSLSNSSSLSEVTARLQRMMLNLQQYDLHVSYIPGKFLFIADSLSRSLVDPLDKNDELDEKLRIQMNLLISNLAVRPEKLKKNKVGLAKRYLFANSYSLLS